VLSTQAKTFARLIRVNDTTCLVVRLYKKQSELC